METETLKRYQTNNGIKVQSTKNHIKKYHYQTRLAEEQM